MQTYKYSFPAHGNIGGQDDAEQYRSTLEIMLTSSGDCLGTWAMFPSESDILESVSFDMDKEGNINAVNLNTYTELWEGREADLKTCLEENLENTTDIYSDVSEGITVDGDVKALGLQGETPSKLYHIAEKKDLEDIRTKGLIPAQGKNSYKNITDYVYLMEERDIAVWMSVLKQKDNPVLLEVDTSQIKGLETGRVFNDRAYVGRRYSEYRTEETIPASAVKQADLGRGYNELASGIRSRMYDLLDNASESGIHDMEEAVTGASRLAGMNVMDSDAVKVYEWKLEGRKTDTKAEEDDFTKAVESIPQGPGIIK